MNDLIFFIKLDLLVAQPQTFVYWLFCFSFLDKQPPKLISRLLLITFIHSIYTDFFVLFLPLPIHLANSVIAGTILIFLVFKDISTKHKIYLLFFAYSLSIFLDFVIISLVTLIYGNLDHQSMLRENLGQMISILYPVLIILLVLSWFIRKRNLFSLRRFFHFIMEGDRSTLTKVISLMLLQFFLLAVIQLIQVTPDRDNEILNSILFNLAALVSLLALVSIIRLLVRTREQAAKSTQEVYIDDINDMFTSIRGQRHDFLNHVQVIHTMVQMGRTEQLKTYVGDLVKETRDVSDIVHHSSPALAAFIQA